MTFDFEDIQTIINALKDVAAREIVPRFLNLNSNQIRCKSGPDDLVTDADEAAEAALRDIFGRQFAGTTVVGEEAVAANPAVLDSIGTDGTVLLIDPVDGTGNYAAGIPVFGTIVAVISAGVTMAGVIHYPLAGDTIFAVRGQGAWHLTPDGSRQRLQVVAPAPLERLRGLVPLYQFAPADREAVAAGLTAFQHTTSWRCSAYDYRLLARAGAGFCLNASLMPWDHAAGVLIHAESGGYAKLLDGRDYAPHLRSGYLLCAPDRGTWDTLAHHFRALRHATTTPRGESLFSGGVTP